MVLLRSGAKYFGERMKIVGKIMVAWGDIETPRWTSELLQKADLADVEIHIGTTIYRGPLYAMYRQFIIGDALVLSLNWVATRSVFGNTWKYSGACSFRLLGYGIPHVIEKIEDDRRGVGNVWYFFRGGYAIIYLANPREHLAFDGDRETSRVYAWY